MLPSAGLITSRRSLSHETAKWRGMIQAFNQPNPASPLARLLDAPMRPGAVCWIGLRPGRRQPLTSIAEADLDPELGLIGDHYQNHGNRSRQVTLIQAEHIAAIASCLGGAQVSPNQLRRNIVVSEINLHALKNRRFRLGSALLLATGECHPCSRMEEVFGGGGYNAVRGHGGITARVMRAGRVETGDVIGRCEPGIDSA